MEEKLNGDDDLQLETEEDEYSIMSETREGDEEYIKVSEQGDGVVTEVMKESNGTVLLSTLQAHFKDAVGLRYKGDSGSWRGVRMLNGVLEAPHGGWGFVPYILTVKKGGKLASKLLSCLLVF